MPADIGPRHVRSFLPLLPDFWLWSEGCLKAQLALRARSVTEEAGPSSWSWLEMGTFNLK